MVKEMPRRYWKNLPEARMIGPLIAGAQAKEAAMTAHEVAPINGRARSRGLPRRRSPAAGARCGREPMLDRALGEARVDRDTVYVTNAVKHFKFVMRGKRRLHQTPTAGEVTACRWWLDQEIGLLRPRAVVMLGATAIRGVTGKAGAVGALRGRTIETGRGAAVATFHPAYVLRLPERDAADRAFAGLVEDLRRGAEVAEIG
jgi:DNA polymerase